MTDHRPWPTPKEIEQNLRPVARFWASLNGSHVKLTLTPERKRIYHRARTRVEGGYCLREQSWKLHEQTSAPYVTHRCHLEQRDCNGWSEHWFTKSCGLVHLKAGGGAYLGWDDANRRAILDEACPVPAWNTFAEPETGRSGGSLMHETKVGAWT